MTTREYRVILNYIKSLIQGTEFEGHVYSVGGCERDAYMGYEIKDIDLVVDLFNGGINFAKWLEETGQTLGSVVTYPNFGTAMLRLKAYPDEEIEMVHTRCECYRDEDSRNPETSFGTIQEDCQRRDFTYNAIYYDISNDKVCYFNPKSEHDIFCNVLRTCGEPDIIFNEDPLRILRAVRFACRYNSKITPSTLDGMKAHAARLSIISKERIQEELIKILTGKNVSLGMFYLCEIGALPYIFPSFGNTLSDKANLMQGISIANTDDLATNLSIILDGTQSPQEELKQLKFSNGIIDECLDLTNINTNFLILDDEVLTDAVIRKFQYACRTYPNMVKHLNYMRAIYERSNIGKITYEVGQRTEDMIRHGSAMFGYKLPVDGNDVMEVKQIAPCAAVKRYLDALLTYAYRNPGITKDECITLLKYN